MCADAFLNVQTVVVADVEAYPGHIACDGETKSEAVIPLVLHQGQTLTTVGVMDLDCVVLDGFDDADRHGLENIAKMVVEACDWHYT